MFSGWIGVVQAILIFMAVGWTLKNLMDYGSVRRMPPSHGYNEFGAPVCTPSRARTLTGWTPAENGSHESVYIPVPVEQQVEAQPEWQPVAQPAVEPEPELDFVAIAQALNARTYEPAHFVDDHDVER